MLPGISIGDTALEVRWGSLTARVDRSKVRFAHLGCMLLGTIKQVPAELGAHWDERFGRAWKNKKDATERLARSLAVTAEQAQAKGIVLWDTMWQGSDYWRPGNLLTKTADHLRRLRPGCDVAYAREDALCPPAELLEAFRADTQMTFGQYAEEYARYLRSEDRLSVAAGAVLQALACDRLAVFCCIDPYIPDYGRTQEVLRGTSYADRHWQAGLREEGCHRVVLAEELARFFVERGVGVQVLEAEPTFAQSHVRRYPRP
jgi:hypothetical protein